MQCALVQHISSDLQCRPALRLKKPDANKKTNGTRRVAHAKNHTRMVAVWLKNASIEILFISSLSRVVFSVAVGGGAVSEFTRPLQAKFLFQTATAVVADQSIPIDRVSDAGEPFVQFLSNGMIYIWPAPPTARFLKHNCTGARLFNWLLAATAVSAVSPLTMQHSCDHCLCHLLTSCDQCLLPRFGLIAMSFPVCLAVGAMARLSCRNVIIVPRGNRAVGLSPSPSQNCWKRCATSFFHIQRWR